MFLFLKNKFVFLKIHFLVLFATPGKRKRRSVSLAMCLKLEGPGGDAVMYISLDIIIIIITIITIMTGKEVLRLWDSLSFSSARVKVEEARSGIADH